MIRCWYLSTFGNLVKMGGNGFIIIFFSFSTTTLSMTCIDSFSVLYSACFETELEISLFFDGIMSTLHSHEHEKHCQRCALCVYILKETLVAMKKKKAISSFQHGLWRTSTPFLVRNDCRKLISFGCKYLMHCVLASVIVQFLSSSHVTWMLTSWANCSTS